MGTVQVFVAQIVRDGAQPSLPIMLAQQITDDSVLLVSDEETDPSDWVAVNDEDEVVAPSNPGNYAMVISIGGTSSMRCRFGVGVTSAAGGWILRPGLHGFICAEAGAGVCITQV